MTACGCAAFGGAAWSLPVAALSNRDASRGLKQALTQGVDVAIAKLGVTDGFLKNPRVKIPLPPPLAKANRVLSLVGMGHETDALVVAMNRAAEAAVPEGKIILKQALQRMTLIDAKQILTGGDDAATQYFRRTAYGPLEKKFEPIVARETAKVGLAARYDAIAAKGESLGLLKPNQASIEAYVTQKTLDGLFLVIAQEERAIREDPMGQASALLKKVFGAVR